MLLDNTGYVYLVVVLELSDSSIVSAVNVHIELTKPVMQSCARPLSEVSLSPSVVPVICAVVNPVTPVLDTSFNAPVFVIFSRL